MADKPAPLTSDDIGDTPFERCRAYVARRQSVAPKDLTKDLGLAPSVARAYLKSLEAEGLVGAPNELQRRLVVGTELAAADADPMPGAGVQLSGAQLAELHGRLPQWAQGRLRTLVDRIEAIEEAQAVAAGDKREVYNQAQGEGFDLKALKRLIAIRKLDPQKHAETEALVDLYQSQLEPRVKDARADTGAGATPGGTVH
jgi:uncharacterized protein (UPF0335 family)